MRSSNRRHGYSNRRRRRGRNSLYTRSRCDPDPWNGSPPKTPPSSDDEVNENEYAINSTLNRITQYNYARPTTETVAPAPVNIAHHHKHNKNTRNLTKRNNPNNHNNGDRLNEVKRKLSKYVKMENANVLQCHQFTPKQTKLNVRKTAPVPLPSSLKIGKKKSKHNKPKKQKQTAPAPKPQLFKPKQKKTAPAPMQQKQLKSKTKPVKACSSKPAKSKIVTHQNINVEKKKEKDTKKEKILSTETASFKMRAFAEPFIPVEDHIDNEASIIINTKCAPIDNEVVDFASIPDLYFIGDDSDILNQRKKEQITLTNIGAIYKDIAIADIYKDEISSFSPNSTPNSSYEHFVMSDITNSDYSPITPSSSSREQIVLKEISTNVDENIHNIAEDEVYFNDDRYVLLAEKILEEAIINDENANRMKQSPYEQYEEYNPWNDSTDKKQINIWAEPIAGKSTPASQTLGGLLMHGLPPISTSQLFHQ